MNQGRVQARFTEETALRLPGGDAVADDVLVHARRRQRVVDGDLQRGRAVHLKRAVRALTDIAERHLHGELVAEVDILLAPDRVVGHERESVLPRCVR